MFAEGSEIIQDLSSFEKLQSADEYRFIVRNGSVAALLTFRYLQRLVDSRIFNGNGIDRVRHAYRLFERPLVNIAARSVSAAFAYMNLLVKPRKKLRLVDLVAAFAQNARTSGRQCRLL